MPNKTRFVIIVNPPEAIIYKEKCPGRRARVAEAERPNWRTGRWRTLAGSDPSEHRWFYVKLGVKQEHVIRRNMLLVSCRSQEMDLCRSFAVSSFNGSSNSAWL